MSRESPHECSSQPPLNQAKHLLTEPVIRPRMLRQTHSFWCPLKPLLLLLFILDMHLWHSMAFWLNCSIFFHQKAAAVIFSSPVRGRVTAPRSHDASLGVLWKELCGDSGFLAARSVLGDDKCPRDSTELVGRQPPCLSKGPPLLN